MADINTAKQAIEEHRYEDAMIICSRLIEEGQQTTEIYSISAQALLLTMTSPSDEMVKKAVFQSVDLAASAAETYDDICALEFGMHSAYYRWHEECVRRMLHSIEENQSVELWRSYLQQVSQFGMIDVQFMLNIPSNENVKKIRSETDQEERDSIWKKYDNATEKTFPEAAEKELIYESGLIVFQKAVDYLEQNKDLHHSALQNMIKAMLLKFVVADSMITQSIPDKKKATDDDKVIIAERLKSAAECQNYMLSALIYPDGKPMSLAPAVDNRRQQINSLEQLYNEIKQYDPDFVAPSLPSVEGVQLQTQGSGGCYVATAVYGSYDCPQVWTLRRYRDYTLAETWYGRAFIHTYYAVSPTFVKWFGEAQWFRNMWKPKLDRMVKRLNEEGVVDTPYQDRKW